MSFLFFEDFYFVPA